MCNRILCPYCKENISHFDEGYCPYCGAVFNLSEAEKRNSETALSLMEVKESIEEEEWHAANQKLIQILRRYPKHRQARELLAFTRKEQKFARLYDLAQFHRRVKRWDKAIDYLLQIEELRPEYMDSARLIEIIEKEKWLDKHDPKRQRRADRLVRIILGILIAIYLLLMGGGVAVLLFSPGGILVS